MAPSQSRLDIKNNDTLKEMATILESEFREISRYLILNSEYKALVEQYHIVKQSLSTNQIAKDAGKSTLKAIGQDLKHSVQSMDAKVRLVNQKEQIRILRNIMESSAVFDKRKEEKQLLNEIPYRYASGTFNTLNRSRQEPELKSRRLTQGGAIESLYLLKSSQRVQDALDGHN